MFEHIYQWLQELSFYMILVTAVTYALPANSYRKYIRFFTGLILILMLITPVMTLFGVKDITVKFDELKDAVFEVENAREMFHTNRKIEVEEIVIGH